VGDVLPIWEGAPSSVARSSGASSRGPTRGHHHSPAGCTITLTAAAGPIQITKTLTLVGAGATQTVLDGGNVTRVLTCTASRPSDGVHGWGLRGGGRPERRREGGRHHGRGTGGGLHVQVFNGATAANLASPVGSSLPYDPAFTGRVFVGER
jgi:hypothetical protein